MRYDASQCFTISEAMREANDRAEDGWKLHTLLMKGSGDKLVYTLVFEKAK